MNLKPVISEHSLKEAAKGRFSFKVERGTDKPTIKKTIEKVFGVEVTKIETSAIAHKTYRVGRNRQERRSTRGKKAVVTLKEGQKIDLFEVGENA